MGACFGAEALHGLSVIDGFGSVDTDEPHRLGDTLGLDLHGVAVDDPDDDGISRHQLGQGLERPLAGLRARSARGVTLAYMADTGR